MPDQLPQRPISTRSDMTPRDNRKMRFAVSGRIRVKRSYKETLYDFSLVWDYCTDEEVDDAINLFRNGRADPFDYLWVDKSTYRLWFRNEPQKQKIPGAGWRLTVIASGHRQEQ